MSFKKELWNKAVDFHGHQCPGLAIGFRAATIAMEKLGVDRSGDEELVAVVETDACGVDAIQVLTGCSIGKGNLIFKNRGKQAFTVFNRRTGQGIRVYVDTSKLVVDKDDRLARMEAILITPAEKFCKITDVEGKLPESARIFSSIVCDSCGERLAESQARLQDGKAVCLDCYDQYHRGW